MICYDHGSHDSDGIDLEDMFAFEPETLAKLVKEGADYITDVIMNWVHICLLRYFVNKSSIFLLLLITLLKYLLGIYLINKIDFFLLLQIK